MPTGGMALSSRSATRRDRADDVGTDRLGADGVDEIADHGQGDIGLEKGGAYLAQGGVDIGLAQRTAPAQAVENVSQSFAQTLEHVCPIVPVAVCPNTYRADARAFADRRSPPGGTLSAWPVRT